MARYGHYVPQRGRPARWEGSWPPRGGIVEVWHDNSARSGDTRHVFFDFDQDKLATVWGIVTINPLTVWIPRTPEYLIGLLADWINERAVRYHHTGGRMVVEFVEEPG